VSCIINQTPLECPQTGSYREETVEAAKRMLPLLHKLRDEWCSGGTHRHNNWSSTIFNTDYTLSGTLDRLIARWESVIKVWSNPEPVGEQAFKEVKALLEKADLTEEELIEVKERVEGYFG